MAELTVQEIDQDGIVATYASAAAGGDTVDNSGSNAGKVFLHVKNGGGSSINVTITSQETSATVPTYGDITLSDEVIAVANGAEKFIGPFARGRFNNSDQAVEVEYSGVTSVTIAALKLKNG